MAEKINSVEAIQLLMELENRFRQFQLLKENPKTRRYSTELKEMVVRARRLGISVSDIANRCGVAASCVHKWFRKHNGSAGIRKLKVVGADETAAGRVVVILCSGVRIELSGTSQLCGNFLQELSVLGVEQHASSTNA